MTKPRQLAPTVGPAHGGFEFLKGSFPGIEGYAIGRMTKSHRGKLYIDDASWGPEADSIEYGYRVPFGGIHVFIGKIGGPKPVRPISGINSQKSLKSYQPQEQLVDFLDIDNQYKYNITQG